MLRTVAPVIEDYQLNDPDDARDFELSTARWVNAAAFHAQCSGAGFDAGTEDRFSHAGSIIAIGLLPDLPPNLPT